MASYNCLHGSEREISLYFFGDNMHITPPEGSISQVKKQSESQSGPWRCLPLLRMFELGNMAHGCTVLSSTLT